MVIRLKTSRVIHCERIWMVLQETWLQTGTVRHHDGKSGRLAKKRWSSHRKTLSYSWVCEPPATRVAIRWSQMTVGTSRKGKNNCSASRASWWDNPICSFDEATSSIDTRTELKIWEASASDGRAHELYRGAPLVDDSYRGCDSCLKRRTCDWKVKSCQLDAATWILLQSLSKSVATLTK